MSILKKNRITVIQPRFFILLNKKLRRKSTSLINFFIKVFFIFILFYNSILSRLFQYYTTMYNY